MKYGKIYDYRNKEEAKKLIGKKVMASDCLYRIENSIEDNLIGILREVNGANGYPFGIDIRIPGYCLYQFIREIEEDEPKLMTHGQLAEWLARGNGERKFVDDQFVNRTWGYIEREKNKSVEKNVRIRRWNSDEWIVPSVDIYERDCKGNL